MTLYLQATTTVTDLIIDYIMVTLTDGTIVSLNWDASYIDRYDDGFDAKYKGVYFGEEYANGRIDELQDMQIVDIGLYTEVQAPATILITEMEFVDGDKSLSFEPAYSYTQEVDEDG